ncbi:mucin-5AC-like isoform X1 [Centrocercus urophasianus]|uniref:mucin-5AC-like isoform X1 n=1 Tax=Centrocercus urophasianus TaxID=9002 RepID=UPI001C646E5D|nr:mucin-5AC-like isoform X1 [Centrocercus urophasianus]
MFLFLLALIPSAVSQAATTASANKNVTDRREMSRQSVSTPVRSTDGTLPSTFIMASKDGKNSSAPKLKRISISSATLKTLGDFSTATKDAASVSAGVPFTATPRSSAVTGSTHVTAALPSDGPSTMPSSLPACTALTSPTTTQDGPTSNLNIIQQTEDLKHSSTNTSPVPCKEEDTNKGKTNKRGVIIGISVVVLGFILFCLMGRFLCNTTSGPVLHLGNSLGPYETSFGTAPDAICGTADKAGYPHACICMNGMTSSLPGL